MVSERNASWDFIPTEISANTNNQTFLRAEAKEETINLCKKWEKKKKKSYFKLDLKNYLKEEAQAVILSGRQLQKC